jgi:uncharacterized protein
MPTSCSTKGLTQFIFDLRMKGKTLEQVIEAGRAGPYPGLGAGWFKDRWDSVPRGAEAPDADTEGRMSIAGRAAYIRQLRRDGLNWDDAIEKVKLKYPGSSPSNCKKVWDERGDGTKVQDADTSVENSYEYMEANLHPFLAYFARRNFRAYSKTIHHTTSTKKDFGEWVHPDMIGVYFPVNDWKSEVFDLCAAAGNTALKLYSFELKRALSFGNLREAFFQAVSNSSWANQGFLAAAKISQDEDFLSELQRLSTSFGIGVIELSFENPDGSKCLYPAIERESIDWDALNKLCTMNKDVQDLLRRIKNDLNTKEFIKEQYDTVLSLEALSQLIKKKT